MNHVILTQNLCTMGLNLAYAVTAMAIGLLALRLLDKWIFPEIDLVAEIKKGNIAAAIFAGMIVLFFALVLASAVR